MAHCLTKPALHVEAWISIGPTESSVSSMPDTHWHTALTPGPVRAQTRCAARTCASSRSCATAWPRCCACSPTTPAAPRSPSCCAQVLFFSFLCLLFTGCLGHLSLLRDTLDPAGRSLGAGTNIMGRNTFPCMPCGCYRGGQDCFLYAYCVGGARISAKYGFLRRRCTCLHCASTHEVPLWGIHAALG